MFKNDIKKLKEEELQKEKIKTDSITQAAQQQLLVQQAAEQQQLLGQQAAEEEALNESVNLALNSETKPFIISDMGDNPTAGGAGDVTWTLRELINRKEFQTAQGPALIYASIPGPELVTQALKRGVGKTEGDIPCSPPQAWRLVRGPGSGGCRVVCAEANQATREANAGRPRPGTRPSARVDRVMRRCISVKW
mgnify:CR=1 FL=1